MRATGNGGGAHRWRSMALWGVAALGLCLPSLVYDLRLPDEPRVAHTSLEMLRTGDWIVPTVNGEPFLQTPPLYYWCVAGWLALVGPEHDGWVRLPSILFGLGALAAAWRLARAAAGPERAELVVLLLAGTLGFWDAAHRVVVDTALGCFVAWGTVAAVEVLQRQDFSARRGAFLGFCAGLAYLAKGIVGPAMLAPVAACVLWRGARHGLRHALVFGVAASLACAAVAVPWTIALELRLPGSAQELLVGHVARRVLEGEHHDPSNWAFAHRALLKLCPWAPAMACGLWLALRPARHEGVGAAPADRGVGPALAIAFLAPLCLLLVSRSKRTLYLLPLLPAGAALAVLGIGPWLARPAVGLWLRRAVWAFAVTVPILGAAYNSFLDRDTPFSVPGAAARELERGGHAIVGFRLEEREEAALAWYLRRSFANVGEPAALESSLREADLPVALVGEAADLQAALGAHNLESGRRIVVEQRLRRRTIQIWAPVAP